MKPLIYLIISLIIIVSFGLIISSRKSSTPPTPRIMADEIRGQKITLGDVTGGSAGGTAQRQIGRGLFTVNIKGFDLPAPAKGQFYEGWLEGISLGKLAVIDGSYLVHFSTNQDLSALKKVSVTLESRDDKIPEQPVLAGNFK